MSAVAGKLRDMIREAFEMSSGPIHIKTQSYNMNADLPDKVTIPARRGEEYLIGVAIDVALAVSGGTVSGAAADNTALLDQVDIKADGDALVESNSPIALRELLTTIFDKAPVDTILSAAGTGSSHVIIPVSGRDAKNVSVNIKFPTFATMYSAGTEGAKTCVITAIYSPIALPRFVLFTNSQTYSGTGRKTVDQTGPMEEKAIPSFIMAIGDGTLVVDDVQYEDADGSSLLNAKYSYIKEIFQLRMQTALTANGLVYADINAYIPVSDRDRFMLDVTTAGTFYFGGLYAKDNIMIDPEQESAKQGSANYNNPVEEQPDFAPNQPSKPIRQQYPIGYKGSGMSAKTNLKARLSNLLQV